MNRPVPAVVMLVLTLVLSFVTPAGAHSGPPYPAISSRVVGEFTVAVWTDPDTTDDGSAQGKFWVTVQRANGGHAIEPGTRVDVAIQGRQAGAARQTMHAALVKNDPATFYAALRMDHEGPFAVHVTIDGGGRRAELDCEVQATYDLRPAPFLLVLYVMPFLLVALLWAKLLIARRRASQRRSSSPRVSA